MIKEVITTKCKLMEDTLLVVDSPKHIVLKIDVQTACVHWSSPRQAWLLTVIYTCTSHVACTSMSDTMSLYTVDCR